MNKSKHPVENNFNRLSRYHIYCFLIMFLCKIPMYWHIMNLIFLSPPMTYYCHSNSTSAEYMTSCPCEEPRWDRSVFTQTMQTKFNIVCHRVWLISFSQSIMYLGTLIGSLLFGFAADRFGRLSMFSVCCVTLGISGCLVSVMPTAASYIFMRCLEGIGVGGAIVTGYVLLVEMCGIKYRDTVTTLYHIPINIGHISLAGISYKLRHCDAYQLALSIPVFLCALSWFIMYESPKWLLDSEQIGKAVKVMQKIAKFNGKETNDAIQTQLEEYHATQLSKTQKKIRFCQIFRHRRLSLNLFCMAFVYLVTGMGYYGVSQYIGHMSGDIHMNVALSGAILIPGTIATVFLLKLLSRRIFLIATNFLSGLSLIAVVCIPSEQDYTRMVVACIGNSFFFMSFIIVFLYAVELFPTAVRNSVLGFLSVLSRVGQIIAPPINALSATTAGAIFGGAAILGAILCYPLPETKNKELPSTLEDSKTLPRTPLRISSTE